MKWKPDTEVHWGSLPEMKTAVDDGQLEPGVTDWREQNKIQENRTENDPN